MKLVAYWTKQLTKKHKTYHDGFIKWDERSRVLQLLDEKGEILSSKSLDQISRPPEAHEDDIRVFTGFLCYSEEEAGEGEEETNKARTASHR